MRQFNRSKRAFSVLLALTIVISSIQIFTYASAAAPALPAVNDQTPGKVCNALSIDAKAYYTGTNTYENLIGLSGASDVSTSEKAAENNNLYNALQTLMTSTHTFQTSYSGTGSGSLAYYWQRTDAVAGHDGYFMLIYKGEECSVDSSSAFNREHVWPKSNASFNQSGGGSDLHHLRPADPLVNSTRGNLPFGNVKGVYSNATQGSCYWKTSSLFEPRDAVKGDIARILLYVYVRWGENNIYSDTGNGEKIIESLDTLLQWIALDPVDTWEMKRNDLTEDVQGNRNVFIDYPELAFRLFGREIPAGTVTPSSASVCTHSDDDCNGYCDLCGVFTGISTVTLSAAQTLADGEHVAFFNPANGQTLSKTVNGNNRIDPVAAQPSSGTVTLSDPAQIFTAQKEGEYYYFVTRDGKYLSTAQTGNQLFYSDEKNDYGLWNLVPAGNELFKIVSVNAKYNGKDQALEYYGGVFTTYSVGDADPFRFGIYTTGHFFGAGDTEYHDDGSVTVTKTCLICGLQDVRSVTRGDANGDGEIDATDLTAVARHVAQIETIADEALLLVSDVDRSGSTDAGDLTLLARFVAKIIDTFDDPLSDVPPQPDETSVTDILTVTQTGASGTNYKSWTYTSAESGVSYAGQSAAGYSAIQIRSSNSNSGIVVTNSGMKAVSVKITFNGNTASGRTIDVYGKNAEYTGPTDLYNENTKGTKLGSLTASSVQLDITGDYQFIALRSNSGAAYLDSVEIVWKSIA